MYNDLFSLFGSVLSNVLSMQIVLFCFGIAFVMGFFLLVQRLMRV